MKDAKAKKEFEAGADAVMALMAGFAAKKGKAVAYWEGAADALETGIAVCNCNAKHGAEAGMDMFAAPREG